MFVYLFFLITRDALRFPNFERPNWINIFKAQNQTNLIFNFKRPKSNLPQISCSLFEKLETKFELFKRMKKKNQTYPKIRDNKWNLSINKCYEMVSPLQTKWWFQLRL